MFFLGFAVGFLACSLLCIEMLHRKGLMNKDGVIVDLNGKNPPNTACSERGQLAGLFEGEYKVDWVSDDVVYLTPRR